MNEQAIWWLLSGAVVLLLLVVLRVMAIRRRRIIVLPDGTESGGAARGGAASGGAAAPGAASSGPPAPAVAEMPALPDFPKAEGPADDLRQIKGIGPKLQAMLNEMGVTRFDQIAAWTPEQLAAIDARLGPFQGRPERDRWQEQARLLAAGDTKAFEKAHGKLGGAA